MERHVYFGVRTAAALFALGCGAEDGMTSRLPMFGAESMTEVQSPPAVGEGAGPEVTMGSSTPPEVVDPIQTGLDTANTEPVPLSPACMDGSPGATPSCSESTPSNEPTETVPPGVSPVASNASPQARNLLSYLYSTYGQQMLSGQMESTWMPGGADYEIDYVQSTTGKLPAVRGLDFIAYDGVAERAISWWELGGIPNIRWHWGAPTRGVGYEASQEEVDIERVLTPGTAEHTAMLAGLDRTALELTKLRDANVPVLWTPFHELNGDWFWWGKGTSEQFVRLWRFMFEYFDGPKGLNNLIWVLGYTGQPDGDWYPGDEYVDIAGADSYGQTDSPQLGMFDAVRDIVGAEMPVSYHECGIIPNPDQAQAQGAHWSWFMTWHTDWLTDENTTAHLNAVYDHEFVITLDELPDLR